MSLEKTIKCIEIQNKCGNYEHFSRCVKFEETFRQCKSVVLSEQSFND